MTKMYNAAVIGASRGDYVRINAAKSLEPGKPYAGQGGGRDGRRLNG
jgi:hypothetical protein